MENNIVVFGPAHAGKSTLIGYFYVNYAEKFDFDKFKQKHRENSWWNESSKYSFLVDQTDRERLKGRDLPKNEQKKGTSLYVHYARVLLGNEKEFLFVDTPGMPFKIREKARGIFFGDIGVFMVECNNIKNFKLEKLREDRATITEFLSPLLLWSKFHRRDQKLIILLSKMDEANFSQEVYEDSKNIVKKICDDLKVEIDDIIPTSIDVRNETDHGILKNSEMMSWYSGPTVAEKLSSLWKSTPIVEEEKPLMISLDADKFKIDGIGKVLRGKVLQGELKVGDVIKIEPLMYKGKVESILAKVRNIRKERGEDTKEAQEGDIIGINISDITTFNGKRCDINECDFYRTSLILSKDFTTQRGDIFEFFVPSKGNEDLYRRDNMFHLFETIQIIWLGRLVASEIINVQTVNEGQVIRLRLLQSTASFPLTKDNTYCFNRFVLKRGDLIFSARLQKFGSDVNLEIFA